MRVSILATIATALWMAAGVPAATQQYSAKQTGDVVQLADATHQTTVSILPSVGNIAFEMKVKGHNVLRCPHASIEEFKAKPGSSGIPLLAPWANRLDEQAFYANGKRYAVRHGARQRARRDSDSRLSADHRTSGRWSRRRPTANRRG